MSLLTAMLAFSCAASAISRAQEAPGELTLKQAIAIALDKNPAVRQSRERLAEATELKASAFSQVFPSIAANLDADYKKDPVNLGNPAFGGEPYNFYDFGFSATQPLFRGGALTGAIDVYRNEELIRAQDLAVTSRDLELSVIKAFYAVLTASRKLSGLEENLRVNQELLQMIHARALIGRSSELEVLQTRTQIALLEPRITQAKNQLTLSAVELSTLLGDREAKAIAVKGTLQAPPAAALEKIKANPAATRPELLRAQAQEAQAESKKTVGMAKYWPALSAVGNFGRAAYVKTELASDYANSWTVGLQLTIPLFSGLSSVHDNRSLASQITQARLGYDAQANQSALELAQASKELDAAAASVRSSQEALGLARAAFAEAKRLFRLGQSIYPQVLQAQQSLLEADLAFDQAEQDLILSAARMVVASGHPLDELVELLPPESR